MKISKLERRKNGIQFYYEFMRNEKKNAAVVIEKEGRCYRFITMLSGRPVIIAKSSMGVEGCFMEFLENIHPCPQKFFYEDEFEDWLEKIYKLKIVYKDELVILFEKSI